MVLLYDFMVLFLELSNFISSHFYIISHNCGFISRSETLIRTIWHCISQCECSSHFCKCISYNCGFISHKVTISYFDSQCCKIICWIILALLSWNVTSDRTVWHYIPQCDFTSNNVTLFLILSFISQLSFYLYPETGFHIYALTSCVDGSG